MFGLNRAEVIGRLGADVTVNHLTSGGRVANLSIATDESYLDRNSGDRQERTEWHRIVTFQPGLIDMLEKHARKGRLVYVSGTLQTRRWRKDGEESDRFSTEIRLAPGGRVQFLDKPNGANGNGSAAARRLPPRRPTPRPLRRTWTATSRSKRPIAGNVKLADVTVCGLSFFWILSLDKFQRRSLGKKEQHQNVNFDA